VTWSATQRYGLAPAPAGLPIVQDLLNTRPLVGVTQDLLSTVRSAQAWADDALASWAAVSGAVAQRRVRLTSVDLPPLRALRDELVALLQGGTGPAPHCNTVHSIPLVVTMDGSGAVTLAPGATGWQAIAGIIAVEIHTSQVRDIWRRLKTCRNLQCPGSFYDRSPNNSGVWHDVKTCGNLANLHASRARRRADVG
jgi:predicted RNA-binding Zn ribbon-like protein